MLKHERNAFVGLLRPEYHVAIKTMLFAVHQYINVEHLIEDIIDQCGFHRKDFNTIHRHLELYFSYLITHNKRVPFVLYCCKFQVDNSTKIAQYVTDCIDPDEDSAIYNIYSDPKFQNQRQNQELTSEWINKLHFQGYLKLKECHDELMRIRQKRKHSKTSTACEDPPQTSTTSQRYSSSTIMKLLEPEKNVGVIELHKILDHGFAEDYITLSYSTKEQTAPYYMLQQLINNKFIPTHSSIVNTKSDTISHNFVDHADFKSQNNDDDSYYSECDIFDEDIQELKKLFFQVLGSRKLVPRTFFFTYLRDAFSQLICKDSRGHRWSPSVLCFAQDLLVIMGYNAYEALARGLKRGQEFEPSSERCNLVLPCSSTLDHHFHTASYGEGNTKLDKDDFDKLVEKMKVIENQNFGLVQIDAVDVTPHLGINTKLGLVYGANEGPLKISDCTALAQSPNFPPKGFLAEKIVQTLYCSINGEVRIPGNFKVCTTETEQTIRDTISEFRDTYTRNIVCTVSDAGSANYKYFTSSPNELHHFCYSHHCKNMRNAINGRPKLYPVATKVGAPNLQIARHSSACISSNDNGNGCHLMKIVIQRTQATNIPLSFIVNDKDTISFEWKEKEPRNFNSGGISFYHSSNDNELSVTLLSETLHTNIGKVCVANFSNQDIAVTKISCSILQRFELNTLDEIYRQQPLEWCKIVKRSSFIKYDDQSEDVLRDVCNLQLLEKLRLLNERTNYRYLGFYKYLKAIHDLFHVYDDKNHDGTSSHNLHEVLQVLKENLDYLNEWDTVFQDVIISNKNNNFTLSGTLTKNIIIHNIKTIQKLIRIIPQDAVFDLSLLGTRSLEGFFGESRDYSKRTTVLDYHRSYSNMKIKLVKKECVYLSYNNDRKRKYCDAPSQINQQILMRMTEKQFVDFNNERKQARESVTSISYSFTDQDLICAKDLQLRCLQHRVNSIRQSYHQSRHDYRAGFATDFMETSISNYYNISLPVFHIETSEVLPNLTERLTLTDDISFTIIQTHDSLIHAQNHIAAFLLKKPVEFEIKTNHISLSNATVEVRNFNENNENASRHSEPINSFKIFVAPNQTDPFKFKLIGQFSSTTSTKLYQKQIAVIVG
ncbi:hypothetical protein C9374_000385, partial [Naegleria lovaniensis]